MVLSIIILFRTDERLGHGTEVEWFKQDLKRLTQRRVGGKFDSTTTHAALRLLFQTKLPYLLDPHLFSFTLFLSSCLVRYSMSAVPFSAPNYLVSLRQF